MVTEPCYRNSLDPSAGGAQRLGLRRGRGTCPKRKSTDGARRSGRNHDQDKPDGADGAATERSLCRKGHGPAPAPTTGAQSLAAPPKRVASGHNRT